MTDPDVAALEQVALATPADPVVERAWALATRDDFRLTEQRMMAEFRMWKFVRADQKMQECAKALEQLRACLAYLNQLTT